ncbi:MAG: glutamine--fructose-6-phosphate transaminase (isomerizing) [Candidatus Falkowbacteria bacterium]|nr:glutamine--fructose-6-phosphate transaminase (isomerizing) [Candidatus Falkowbacteria bacterium]
MCGIVGYLGKKQALPVLIEGLKRLEYRGYDSAGIAILNNHQVNIVKALGKISELQKKIKGRNLVGNLGIAHTRWATHGQPSEKNAHPHCDCQGKIWVVHNGIIENYQKLKGQLINRGHTFSSDTDTEVIAHLLEELYHGNLTSALQQALKLIEGAYGLAIIHVDEPTKLVAARYGSPLVVGLGKKENFIASDIAAILKHTKRVIYLNDGEIAEINDKQVKIFDAQAREKVKNVQLIEEEAEPAEKQGYPHFMLKEIFEQPESIINSIRGRMIVKSGKVKLGGLESVLDKIKKIERMVIVACGTARHAGLIGEYMLEEYAGLPTEVEYASEFRYRQPVLDSRTAVLAISQSGETADTLAAINKAKEKKLLTMGIINAVGSSIARETDAGIYNHIGSEIAVASTKAFTSQVSILALLTVLIGRERNMSQATGKEILSELKVIPKKIELIFKQNELIESIAKKYLNAKNFAFLGRKYNQPVAQEGALKLKEISYIHAEGFPAGEMKHGSIALINDGFPSIFIAPIDSVYKKNVSNIEEIKARAGKIIAITTTGNNKLKGIVDDIIYIPKTIEMLTPILSVIPLQLFAYHMAVLKGCDVDKPRNLAKSVTVE